MVGQGPTLQESGRVGPCPTERVNAKPQPRYFSAVM